ncbi:hypothetical protein [Gryllotalpicola koreensis]|uniref:Transglutaminase domain-containing protein n=1 Tax=Gryllotalpicola koreensis TaxID=993086 RepID=A0ABP7ZX29_9MICO
MMTPTALITPWYRRLAKPPTSRDERGSTAATAILDHRSAEIRGLIARAGCDAKPEGPSAVLEAAYALIRDEVRAVYALEETTPASRTLARGFGSCSQRLAILESAARGLGIATRARALLVDRSFWYPRFPRVRRLLPAQVLLVWPEFEIAGEWRPASELFGAIGCRGGRGFRNQGAETLFEAAGRCAVDWDGHGDAGDPYDLSHFVRADLGHFADRDTVFARFGQTLCAPSRALADPILRRIAA